MIQSDSNARIWKYEIPAVASKKTIKAPKGMIPLYLDYQPHNKAVFLWAQVNPEVTETAYEFMTIYTDNPMPDGYTYVGTVQMGPYISHVYYKEVGIMKNRSQYS